LERQPLTATPHAPPTTGAERTLVGRNVLAASPGSDPALREQARLCMTAAWLLADR